MRAATRTLTENRISGILAPRLHSELWRGGDWRLSREAMRDLVRASARQLLSNPSLEWVDAMVRGKELDPMDRVILDLESDVRADAMLRKIKQLYLRAPAAGPITREYNSES